MGGFILFTSPVRAESASDYTPCPAAYFTTNDLSPFETKRNENIAKIAFFVLYFFLCFLPKK
jgi:hypothetical protein